MKIQNKYWIVGFGIIMIITAYHVWSTENPCSFCSCLFSSDHSFSVRQSLDRIVRPSGRILHESTGEECALKVLRMTPEMREESRM